MSIAGISVLSVVAFARTKLPGLLRRLPFRTAVRVNNMSEPELRKAVVQTWVAVVLSSVVILGVLVTLLFAQADAGRRTVLIYPATATPYPPTITVGPGT